jgi:hypothetical protein
LEMQAFCERLFKIPRGSITEDMNVETFDGACCLSMVEDRDLPVYYLILTVLHKLHLTVGSCSIIRVKASAKRVIH